MKHVFLLAKLRMGHRFVANAGRGHKVATAAIIFKRYKNGKIAHGIGILWPDTGHFYFAAGAGPFNAEKLYRGMQAASKIFEVSTDMIEFALRISDPDAPLPEVWPPERFGHFSSDYKTPASLREAVFAEDISGRELRDIRREYKRRSHWVHRVGDKALHFLRTKLN